MAVGWGRLVRKVVMGGSVCGKGVSSFAARCMIVKPHRMLHCIRP